MDPHGTDEALLYANTKLILQNFSQFSDPSILDALPPSGPASDLRDGSNDRSESHDLGRTKRRRLQPKAKTILEACFDRHRDDPYIPQNEQRELAAQTGLSLKQIRTFFANARARKLPPPSSQTSDYEPKDNSPTNTYDAAKPAHNASTGTKNIDIPGSTSRDSEQGPMERFLSSSPEDEGISEEAVQRAAESLSSTNFSPPGLRKHSSTTDSISVSDTAFSSNSGSSSSKASIDSANSRGPRRGRKRQRGASQGTLAILLRKPSEPSKIYQCTFCTTDFTQKYDWRRHEESVHFPQKEWVCIPDGPADDASGGGKRCVFCQLQDPSSDHFEEHNCSSCISAPRARRTFTRKDKLQQHLIQVHRLDQCSEITKGWHRPVERSVTLACGFCGIILPDWPVRVDHIASHFNDRIGMDLWMSPPGGIVASGSIDEGTKKRYEVSATVDGEFMCEQCDDRFDNVSHYIFHTRQKHKTYGEEQRNFASVFGTPMFWPKTPTQTGVTDLANQTAAMKLFQHRNPGGMPRLRPPTPLGHRRPSNGSGPMGNGTPSVMPPNPNPSSFFGVSNIHKSSSQSLAANPHANWHTPTKGYPTNVPPQAWDLSLDQRQRVIQSRTGTAKPAEMLPGPEQVSFGYSTMHQPLAEQPQSQLQQNTTTGMLPLFAPPSHPASPALPQTQPSTTSRAMPSHFEAPSLIDHPLDQAPCQAAHKDKVSRFKDHKATGVCSSQLSRIHL
ncbi:hypothetical protein BCR34DRAFT_109175 [Clohesyomyces aquaticus]|uniref:Homeobox domain-containing protein n=1 Tax=Clohesyomyces aquaticus TaxID=1231657 RepID=A0A1Y1YSQ3_9PLEO|nr:hypothetical protein BCR34DRAFT_109175 [Clohesyomyces aquaticus]